jgi:hypothetical protein
MFWNAVLVSGHRNPLDRPEEDHNVQAMVAEELWVPFTAPFFTTVIVFLYAGLFKVSDHRIINSKTVQQYKKLV